jgi:trans-AT polyketide synthase, acyltransferase and oxidoreductase domains
MRQNTIATDFGNGIFLKTDISSIPLKWQGADELPIVQIEEIQHNLRDLETAFYLLQTESGIALAKGGKLSTTGHNLLGFIPTFKPERLGNDRFKQDHQTKFAYYAGAMANGIASVEMVIALGKQGYLACFGTGGLPLLQVEAAIEKIQAALGTAPYAFNLLHSPADPQLEKSCVDLYLKYGIRTIEASAFMSLSPNLVRYRASGLFRQEDGTILDRNRIIAKISRREVAEPFLKPAPESILNQLVVQGSITAEQAHLASRVPVASDLTVEADSGGHTDNRPLVCLLPSIQAIRNRIQQEYGYEKPTRVGAAGGLGTPAAIAATFAMEADYVVLGSVNQACLESGTSHTVKAMLAQVDMADVMMAPAADMFEMGVKVQVLKRGTFYPIRAQKLYEIYRKYDAIEAIPVEQRQKIEQEIFQTELATVWSETMEFFQQKDPRQVEKALKNPKHKMALIFRWYLSKSSSWAKVGSIEHRMNYQIWCSPAMGAFNEWTKGSYLEHPENRSVVDVTEQLMRGAAYLSRLRSIDGLGVNIRSNYEIVRSAVD